LVFSLAYLETIDKKEKQENEIKICACVWHDAQPWHSCICLFTSEEKAEKGKLFIRRFNHRHSKILAPIFERPFDTAPINRSRRSIKPNWWRKAMRNFHRGKATAHWKQHP
jgi:hypothetical protein